MLIAAAVVGVLADQSLRTGRFGLAASLTLGAGAGAVVTLAPLRRTESRLLVGAAALLASFLTIRASPWLLWPDLLAAMLLLGAAASLALRGSIFDAGAAEMTARSLQAVIQVCAGGAFVARPVLGARGRFMHAAPALRGVLIALPIAALLGGLLASADPVFASFFNLNIDLGTLALDVFFVAVGALAAAGLLRLAAAEPLERIDGPVWRLGATETLVVLAVLDAVFAAFAVAQVLAATGAAAETLRAAGVTYADYARSGFFQLLWVSGITLAVLYLFSRIGNLADRGAARAFMVLALCAIALTLMIDVVAFRRLSLYEEAYGFTMLRLYSHVFAASLGVVFLLLAADFMGVWRGRRWFAGAALTTAVAVLVGLNVASPEAMVVAFNTSHAQTAHKIDASYLAELSSDATESLLSSRESLDPALRAQVTHAACSGASSYSPAWAAWNLADAQAADARRAGC
ncbi:MAG TPA: DUF4173 domain-containing protein [Candidatus Dormibacteraeota bacterium]|nr:DUF4173 domain-containing protein [Candidatus Dormibacteraeota bacterium]